jgi:prepilin-type N-terminal cleavage/methylation domain-containing protein
MRNKQKGFSLIELLIVVAIILIIAAIAIPNLIRSKMAANEASAVATLRSINTAEVVYSSTYNVVNTFAAALTNLADGGTSGACTPGAAPPTTTNACLIDNAVAAATTAATAKSGYILTYTPPTSTGYAIVNDPANPGSSGVRHFYTDQSLVIRQNATTAASATDAPI